jgi:hypothetical protein
MLKAGDVVMMQFGHNDSGPPDDPARAGHHQRHGRRDEGDR